jgi:hypothetical protein
MAKLERYLIIGLITLIALAVVAIVLGRWLAQTSESPEESMSNAPVTETETMTARVVEVLEEGVREPGGYPYQRVLLTVEDGSLAGQEIEIEEGTVNIISSERLFDVGDRVLLVRDEMCIQEQCNEHVYIADFVRTAPVLWIAALFVGLLLLVGRGRGLRSMAGTLLSLVVIFFFILPMIKAKYDPVMVSLDLRGIRAELQGPRGGAGDDAEHAANLGIGGAVRILDAFDRPGAAGGGLLPGHGDRDRPELSRAGAGRDYHRRVGGAGRRVCGAVVGGVRAGQRQP